MTNGQTTRKRTATNVPNLDHDAMMQREFGYKVGPQGRLERRITAALLDHLQARGFRLIEVDSGEDVTAATTTKAAMELIFNLDEARVVVASATAKHRILLVLGNGEDILSDWSYSKGDADGFNAAMEAFDLEAAIGDQDLRGCGGDGGTLDLEPAPGEGGAA